MVGVKCPSPAFFTPFVDGVAGAAGASLRERALVPRAPSSFPQLSQKAAPESTGIPQKGQIVREAGMVESRKSEVRWSDGRALNC